MYCRENQKLGELDLPVPAAPAGKEGADVRFTYDINGILEVEATSLTTGRTISTVLVGQGSGLTEEQARRRLKELEGLKIHPRDQQKNRLLLAKGERLWQEALGEERQIIGQAVQLFGRQGMQLLFLQASSPDGKRFCRECGFVPVPIAPVWWAVKGGLPDWMTGGKDS